MEPRYVCPTCGSRAWLESADWLVCAEGHDRSVRDIEGQIRRRPALPTDDIVQEFGISRDRLYLWKTRKLIEPTRGPQGLLWFPWDVFCRLNPDIARAFDDRDQVGA